MVRQCAWCLRLINSVGERTSLLPVPKIYEATHGMCQVCGMIWLEAVEGTDGYPEGFLKNTPSSYLVTGVDFCGS